LKINDYEEDSLNINSQISITTNWKNIKPDLETTIISPITVFSWDIECLPENTEEFPRPELPGDIIKQISVVLAKYGTNIKQSFIFTSSPCSSIKLCTNCGKAASKYEICDCNTQWDNAVVIESDNEKNMIIKFCEFIKYV